MKTFDAAIAGGGLIGSAVALELSRAGLRVALLDARDPGKEASWASAGILSPAPENSAMIAVVPLGRASMALYPDFAASVEEISGLPTGYRAKGTLEVLLSRHAKAELNTIIALHHGLGLKAEAISAEEARELEPSISEEVEAAVLRPDEASIDNRLLVAALLEAAKQSGAQIFPGVPVRSIWTEGSYCRGLILASGEKIAARHTVAAAGCFSSQITGVEEFAPVRPAKGQMVSLRNAAVSIERVLWSERIYLVPRNDGRILAGATVEHVGYDKTVTAAGILANLAAAIELVPALAAARVEESWAGLRPDTPDHLPIIGPTDREGLLMATGHFRSGVLLTPVTAKLIGDYVAGITPTLDCERFSPMRFRAAASRAKASGPHS
ncbi:MAG TPA: glycine oxidase ThiO [Candidatus Acidoferrum sp.]|nr:glycine oxidase ThiO [Candidatus Acidoferrum sp.]